MTYDGPPYFPDDTVPPCDVCGRDVSECLCPICPVCHVQGDPRCQIEHGLIVDADEWRREYNTTHRLSPDAAGYLDAQFSLRDYAELMRWLTEQRDTPDCD